MKLLMILIPSFLMSVSLYAKTPKSASTKNSEASKAAAIAEATPFDCFIQSPKAKADAPRTRLEVFTSKSGLPKSPGGTGKTTFVDGHEFTATLHVDEVSGANGLQTFAIQMDNKNVFRVDFQRAKNNDTYAVYPNGFTITCESK